MRIVSFRGERLVRAFYAWEATGSELIAGTISFPEITTTITTKGGGSMNRRFFDAQDIFINRDKLYSLIDRPEPSRDEIDIILNKALKLKGLGLQDVAALLRIESPENMNRLFDAAGYIKREIYGNRMVLFAPLYTGNRCSNNCTYCAFRKDNKEIKRVVLNMDQIRAEVESLLKEGHKRLLMLCGESRSNALDYFLEAIHTAYDARWNGHNIRRINVELAPMEVDGFRKLKQAMIGTYVCFQETYDPVLYAVHHPTGPKASYEYRLTVMDRAMAGGIDDVGIGALFGLGDYRFEVLAMMEHAAHLEKKFGCGPHTVSVPRIEPADNVALTTDIPNPVSDDDFRKIVAVIRIALPYTGIILSTRESENLRTELFSYGISQISAGSRTNPGGYAAGGETTAQFSLGDHRSLEEVVSALIDQKFIPSFCTGCYRKGRVGHDFMDMAKPGLIKEYCQPNAVFTFMEYLQDFASEETRLKGLALIDEVVKGTEKPALRERMLKNIESIEQGKRDLYF